MALGIKITETMRGTHHFVDPALGDASDRAFYFRLDWGGEVGNVLNPLSPWFLQYDAQGVVFIEGLTSAEIPCTGSLSLDYLRDHKVLYRLSFEHEGKRLRYEGEKTDVRLRHPLMLIKTHTTCYGRLFDEQGKILSRSVVHFDPAALWDFLRSVRVART